MARKSVNATLVSSTTAAATAYRRRYATETIRRPTPATTVVVGTTTTPSAADQKSHHQHHHRSRARSRSANNSNQPVKLVVGSPICQQEEVSPEQPPPPSSSSSFVALSSSLPYFNHHHHHHHHTVALSASIGGGRDRIVRHRDRDRTGIVTVPSRERHPRPQPQSQPPIINSSIAATITTYSSNDGKQLGGGGRGGAGGGGAPGAGGPGGGGSGAAMVQCAGCDRPILDRFLLNVLDRAWHAKCVQCVDCKCNLTEKCFSRDGKLYCRTDFYRRYGTKCAGCSQGISPSDLVRRARNKVFHLKCFTCMVCRKQLSTGEELYVLDENKFICKDDYLSTAKPGQGGPGSETTEDADDFDSKSDRAPSLTPDTPAGSGSGGGGILGLDGGDKERDGRDSGGSVDGESRGAGGDHENTAPDDNSMGAKRRGPRTTIKAKQLETLKAAFAATPKPTRHIREQLAQETGLNMRVIQVWFQNRRSKERRMKQLSSLGARRHFFRNPRRMRALRPGMSPEILDDSPEMVPSAAFGYFSDNSNQGDFGYGNQSFYDFFPGQQGPHGGHAGPDGLGFPMGAQSPAVPTSGDPMSGPMGTGSVNLGADAPYLPHNDVLGQRGSSPDNVGLNLPPVGADSFGPHPNRPNSDGFTSLNHGGGPMSETSVW